MIVTVSFTVTEVPDSDGISLLITKFSTPSAVHFSTESFQYPTVRSEEAFTQAFGKAIEAAFSSINSWSGKGAEFRSAITKELAQKQLSK